MEHLFSPCTRLFDLVDNRGRLEEFRDQNNFEVLQELNLDVSTEEFLSAERAFTYANLYAMLGNGNTVAWLTPHAFVAHAGGFAVTYCEFVGDDYSFNCDADGKAILALTDSSEELLEICDVVLQLLAASDFRTEILSSWRCPGNVSFNATSFAHLMEQCQSLKALTFRDVDTLEEDQILRLGTYSRLDLKISLIRCNITSTGASALAEVLARNQGPTKLLCC
jgi:hypothetical protein